MNRCRSLVRRIKFAGFDKTSTTCFRAFLGHAVGFMFPMTNLRTELSVLNSTLPVISSNHEEETLV